MRKTLTYLFTGLALLFATATAHADHLRPHLLLSASLTGSQEVPAVNTTAQGVASFTLNATRDTLFITGAFSGLSGRITGAHIHEGEFGANGPVVTDLGAFVQGNRLQGFITGANRGPIAPAVVAKYLSGEYYINVHTAANPNGEIRGQIDLETDYGFVAQLTGNQEVPAVSTNAGGFGTFNLAQNFSTMKFRVVVYGLSGQITGAHFHNGAFGTTGPVIQDLMQFTSGNTIEGEFGITPAFLTALANGNIYINVHTAANPSGEIRGQLFYDFPYLVHDARVDGAQMVPPVTTSAKAVVFGELYPTLDTLDVAIVQNGLSGPITNISFYAANAGQANTQATLLRSYPLSGPNSTANFLSLRLTARATSSIVLTPQVVNQFLNGQINVVIATAANPNGEIRGQVYRLAREGYTFSLSGSQERPNPTSSAGYGAGLVSVDRDQSNAHFMMVWGGLSGPITGAHFHTGLRTQTGPVVFDLAPFIDNSTAAYGFWQATNAAPNNARPFTARRSVQFRRDSMYVNLHTQQFPNGEIRGQVIRGAKNLSLVLANKPAVVITESFAAYPNPFQDRVTLTFDARSAEQGTVQVVDLLGRVVTTQTIQVRAGANTKQIALPNVAPGVYLMTVEAGSSKLVSRITKE